MAVTYFVQTEGTYIAYGLSTDTKPVSPPANCMFIELDTARTYKVVASAWLETLNTAYATGGGTATGTNTGDQDLSGKLNTTAFSGLTKISVGTVAPTSPSTGDLWIDTN